MDGALTILDFETTSLENPFAIEIGMIAINENLEEIARYESVIKPPVEVGKKILGMTRLTSDQVNSAPVFDDLWPDIHPFLSNRIVVAHFASFESRVLYKEFHRLGIEEYLPKTLCTRDFTKKIFSGLANYKLEFLTDYFGIQHIESHQAIGDVVSTLDLLRILAQSGDKLRNEILRLEESLIEIPKPQHEAKKAQVRIRSVAEEHSVESVINLITTTSKKRISITGMPAMGKEAFAEEFHALGFIYDKGPIVNAMSFVVFCMNKPGESKIIAAKKMGIPVISEFTAIQAIENLKNR